MMFKGEILYRGITVPKEDAQKIKDNLIRAGIRGDEGNCRVQVPDTRDKLEILFNKQDLTTDDTRAKTEDTVCACGDKGGASYYALVHNTYRNAEEVSFVLSFVMPISAIWIDGRDFLYTCFQLWDREGAHHVKEQSGILKKLFGPNIETYFKKAALSGDQDYRLAMCDLACQDSQVIRDHTRNKIIIGGRHGTKFCSAFSVKPPINPQQIISVEPAEFWIFSPSISLEDFSNGKKI